MTTPSDPHEGNDQAREVARLEAEYALDTTPHALSLANALSALAIKRDVEGDKAGALAHFARAVTVARDAYQSLTPASGDTPAHEALTTHLFNYIQWCLWDGDAADALAGADEALAVFDDLAAASGRVASGKGTAGIGAAEDADATAERALYVDFRAEALRKAGRTAESLEAHSEAALLFALCHDAYPQYVEFLEQHVANSMARVIADEGPDGVHRSSPGT